MSQENAVEKFLDRRLTLDLAELSADQRKEGSHLLGGSAAVFVKPGDEFNYRDVSKVVFHWGDPKINNVFAILLEHIEPPSKQFFAFTPATVIGDMLWSLALQDRDFNPASAYPSKDFYVLLPFDPEQGRCKLQEYLALPTPRPELLGKVGSRYVLFEMAIGLDETPKTTGGTEESNELPRV